MNMKYVRSVPLKKWDLKIKRESGFSMKTKEQIKECLEKEYNDRDGTKPMDEMDWACNQGWIEALEFVLDIEEKRREQNETDARIRDILLTNKERDLIIGSTIKRIQRENQSLIDDEDSESCGVCTCGIKCP